MWGKFVNHRIFSLSATWLSHGQDWAKRITSQNQYSSLFFCAFKIWPNKIGSLHPAVHLWKVNWQPYHPGCKTLTNWVTVSINFILVLLFYVFLSLSYILNVIRLNNSKYFQTVQFLLLATIRCYAVFWNAIMAMTFFCILHLPKVTENFISCTTKLICKSPLEFLAKWPKTQDLWKSDMLKILQLYEKYNILIKITFLSIAIKRCLKVHIKQFLWYRVFLKSK